MTMRPKKNILLYCGNQITTSVTRFILETQINTPFPGYRVYAADTEAVARGIVLAHHDEFFSAAIAVYKAFGDAACETSNAMMDFHVPTIFLNQYDHANHNDGIRATVIFGKSATTAEWLERLRILCARKRGPKLTRQPAKPIAMERTASL